MPLVLAIVTTQSGYDINGCTMNIRKKESVSVRRELNI